tara:strand:- start:97 stop:579 length:483 start_codon:yes stop_codon:yes gene_type:complete
MIVHMMVVVNNIAMHVVIMIMVVVINAQFGRNAFAKQGYKFRVAGNSFRVTGATDMLIQANDLIGRGHDHVKIVRYHQHTASPLITKTADQGVKFRLTTDINALHRLIENQQTGIAQQCASQQDPLQFTTGNLLDRTVGDMSDTGFLEHGMTQAMSFVSA